MKFNCCMDPFNKEKLGELQLIGFSGQKKVVYVSQILYIPRRAIQERQERCYSLKVVQGKGGWKKREGTFISSAAKHRAH